MNELISQGFFIDTTGGNFYMFVGDNVIIEPMSVKDLEYFSKYIDMSTSGKKLRKNPQNAEDRQYVKLYNYFYHKQKFMKKNVMLK